MNSKFLLITFDSTHKAIRTEKLLKEDIKGELIPTPREISASCGLAYKFSEDSLGAVVRLLESKEGLFEGLALYSMVKTGDKKVVTPMELR